MLIVIRLSGVKAVLETRYSVTKIDYKRLEQEGYCTITDKESGIINLQQVIDYMVDHITKNDLQVKGIFYDPYNISLFLNEIEKYGYPAFEVRQGVRTLSRANVKTLDSTSWINAFFIQTIHC
ncbi:terminase TerL endonuclease subunit [Bacillus sp. SL00103]